MKTRYQAAIAQVLAMRKPYPRIATCTKRGVTVTVHCFTFDYCLYSASDSKALLLFVRVCHDPTCPVAWFWHHTPDGRRIKFLIHDFTLCKGYTDMEHLPDYRETTT